MLTGLQHAVVPIYRTLILDRGFTSNTNSERLPFDLFIISTDSTNHILRVPLQAHLKAMVHDQYCMALLAQHPSWTPSLSKQQKHMQSPDICIDSITNTVAPRWLCIIVGLHCSPSFVPSTAHCTLVIHISGEHTRYCELHKAPSCTPCWQQCQH